MCIRLALTLILSISSLQLATAEPLPGQIVVDPEHPQWLIRHGGKHVFICGPGDPEDFLYRGKRLPDGTRDGDQRAIIDKLIEHGGNCLYIQIVRSHGGDGERDHNPFIDSDPAKGIDADILDQWHDWFARMDEHGILIYLFLYDDSARIWRTGDKVEPDERTFVETIVNKFKNFKNLIWIVAEESEEAYSTDRVQAIAQVIRETDEHEHLIGNHHHSGTTFKAFREGGHLNHFAMQLGVAGEAAHAGAIEALQEADSRYQVIYSENTAGEPTARYAWRVAMGGLMPMMFEMDVATTAPEELNRCRHLQQFFESTDFYTMSPRDDLAHAGTKYVLANARESYIVYAEVPEESLGIKGMNSGNYRILWLDCAGGNRLEDSATVSDDGDHTFEKPSSIGDWCAAWVTRQ